MRFEDIETMLRRRWIVSCSSIMNDFYGNHQGVQLIPHMSFRYKCLQASSLNNVLLSLKTGQNSFFTSHSNKNYVARNSLQPTGIPNSSGPPWKGWVLGFVLSVIVPFYWRSKSGSFPTLKDVENVTENVEHVVHEVEKVAEKVEEVADKIAVKLPENGKLTGFVVLVDTVAKETAKKAQVVDELIQKVEEVEEKMEPFIGPVQNKLAIPRKASNNLNEQNSQDRR